MIDPIFIGVVVAIAVFILSGLRVVNEFERGVRFTLGKYKGIMKPGLRLVIPIIQAWKRVDIRTIVVDIPEQDAITKDNVSVRINAVLYYKVNNSEVAILEVEDYNYTVSQLAQTTLRNVIGEVDLDRLLSKRDEISGRIKKIVDVATNSWGIKVEMVELKVIELPEDMKRMMARQAEAEREKRAMIIKAEGEVIAAENMAKAAHNLSKTPGGLHIRTLHTINDLSSEKSKTTIYALPAEILKAAKRLSKL